MSMPDVAIREITSPTDEPDVAAQVASLILTHIRGELAPEEDDVKSELYGMEGLVTVVAQNSESRIMAAASLDRLSQDEAVVRGVVAAERGLGLGKKVMGAIEDSAQNRGVRRLKLFSLPQATRFYEKLDYTRGHDDGRVIEYHKQLA